MLTLTVSWSYDEYKSKNLSEDSTNSYEENSKDIRKKNLFSGQLYISSLRNKFNLLAKKLKLFQKLNSVSLFQLASLELLDTCPLSVWIEINTVDELWFYEKRYYGQISICY